MATLHSLRLLCVVVAVIAEPTPGRVPKVYNALITSNQNLEPSKAYPVYQPVLHETFFPFPTLFYGDFPINNGIQRIPALPPKGLPSSGQPLAPKNEEPSEEKPASSEIPPSPSPEPTNKPEGSTPTPPPPPSTDTPIPLNEFGLPPQVYPLGEIDPAYNGYTQIGPFTYTYPSFRFYDPYDPFSLSPYAPLPALYRPLTNVIGQSAPVLSSKEASPPVTSPPTDRAPQTPPPEPSDLNILNFSSKDPSIPNVPPPPLPQGGLKSDTSE